MLLTFGANVVVAITTVAVAGCGVGPAESSVAGPAPSSDVRPSLLSATVFPQGPVLVWPDDPDRITVAGAEYSGWAMLDLADGRTTGSVNAASEGNTTESMIKPWIVADFLRRLDEDGLQPTEAELDDLVLVIVDSNDPLAELYYQRGGADDVVWRLKRICDLPGVVIEPNLWGMTVMTPLTAVGYGACLADGRAAGPRWTAWLLNVMRNVRGSVDEQVSGAVQGGRWGIIEGLPAKLADVTSIKNGWTLYVDGWHVNCLAIHPRWVLAVMLRTRADLDMAAAGCASVATALQRV
jgi:hypothetical protein